MQKHATSFREVQVAITARSLHTPRQAAESTDNATWGQRCRAPARERAGTSHGRTVERPWQRSKPPSKGKRTEPRSPESLSWVCISVKCEHHPTNTCSHVFVASLWEGGPNEGVCDAPGGSRGGSREDDQGTAGPWVSQAGHPSSTRPGVGSAASWSLDRAMSGQLPMRERPAAPAGIPNGTRNARAKTYLYPVSPLSETSPEE